MKKITLIISFLSVFAITNAQMDENTILDSVSIQKNELIVTQEIVEMVVRVIKNTPEEYIYPIYGIKNKAQLEHLQLGKPIPLYIIANEELKSASMGSKSVDIFNVSRMTDGAPLSLEFTNSWAVPIMYDGEPLSFGHIQVSDFEGFGGYSFMSFAINSTIEQFHNYVHKDLIIGYLNLQSSRTGMDYLIIRKDNKEIYVEVHDEETKEYYKNEYNFSELINRLKELNLRKCVAAATKCVLGYKGTSKSQCNIMEYLRSFGPEYGYGRVFDVWWSGNIQLWNTITGAIINQGSVPYNLFLTVYFCDSTKRFYLQRFVVMDPLNNKSDFLPEKSENPDFFLSPNPNCVTLSNENPAPNFSIIPNPNPGTFQIETNFPLADIAHLKIINLLGVPVYETQKLASNEIQLANSGAGLYFVVIILKDGTVLTQKMMLQR